MGKLESLATLIPTYGSGQNALDNKLLVKLTTTDMAPAT